MTRIIGAVVLVALCIGLSPAPAPAQKAPKDLFTTVKQYAICKQWTKAIQDSGLMKVYQGKDPITMFAPTDDAFAKLKKEELDGLFKEKAKLIKLVTYHTIEGDKLKADDLLAKATLPNSLGKKFAFKKDGDGNLTVEGVLITSPDVPATNGMLHLIDTLLWTPPAK